MKKIVFALAGLLLPPSASASLLPDFGASGGDSQSFSSMDSRGRIEAAQAPQSARSTGIQSDVAAAKVESITSAKFGEMKQNVANGTFNPQAAKASFAKELDKIPSSQMNNAEKATVRREFNQNVDNVQSMVKGGDRVAARAGLQSGQYTLNLQSFNNLSVSVDGGSTGRTVNLMPMVHQGGATKPASVTTVHYTVPAGQTMSFNLTAASARDTVTVVKGNALPHATVQQSYAVSITVQPTGLNANEGGMRQDLAAMGGNMTVANAPNAQSFTGRVFDSGNFSPGIAFTGNAPPSQEPAAEAPVIHAAGAAGGAIQLPAGTQVIGNMALGNALPGMTGLSAAMPLPGKTGVVSIMGQNLALSPQSYAMGEIGSMKPGQGAVNLTNPARTAIVMTPADFNANKPALAAMGADVNNTRLGQTLEMNPTIMDVMVTFPSGNQAGGPPKLKAIDNQFNATGPLKNDFASRGKADTAQVANLVVGFGGQAPEGWESVSSRGVMVAAGKFDPASNTSSTGLLSVGVGNPLKLSNSFVLARPGAIDVGRNIARLTTPSASVVVLSAKDFDANRNPLRQMGVNVASVKATFDAGASHVMIDLRPGSATPVQPISFGSGQQGLQRVAQVSDELRQMR